MKISKNTLCATAALMVVSACGGEDTSAPQISENSVQSSHLTDTTSTDAPPSGEADTVEINTSEAFAALPEPYKSADYNRGRRTFKLCQSCHTLQEGGQNLVGPNLYGMFGRQIGAVEGYSYSRAVQDSEIIWTPDLLAEWLESPRNFLPGNRMSFAGVRRPDDRTAVIAYIMSETGYSSE